MTIADFAKTVNSCLPTVEQIEAHYSRVQDRIKATGLQLDTKERDFVERQSQMVFQYDIVQEAVSPEERIAQLLGKTSIHRSENGYGWNAPGALNFYDEVRKSRFLPNGLEFGVINDYEKLGLNLNTYNIVSYFMDRSDFDIFARDVDQFLSFLAECHQYEMHEIYGVAYAREDRFKHLKSMVREGLSYNAVAQFIHDFR